MVCGFWFVGFFVCLCFVFLVWFFFCVCVLSRYKLRCLVLWVCFVLSGVNIQGHRCSAQVCVGRTNYGYYTSDFSYKLHNLYQ